jgi:hypothetical protein
MFGRVDEVEVEEELRDAEAHREQMALPPDPQRFLSRRIGEHGRRGDHVR